MSTTFSRAAARLLVLPVAATVFTFAPVSNAHADTAFEPAPGVATDARNKIAIHKIRRDAKTGGLGKRAMNVARAQAGDPYVYGATGPNAFDCSGLVQYAFRKVGRNLPRTASAQAGAVHRVGNPRPGDLVFFSNGGHVYHVGIYAGNHQLWHASRPGSPVKKERIWTNAVFYGRV